MYEIIFTAQSLRDLEELDESTRQRIAEKLKSFSASPFQHAKKLTDSKIGDYRFRIGDYRVVFDVDVKTIVVLRIGHRKDIYR
jgi:mRNA interferase RelE/StbE